jgi:hypothetical protein
VRGHVALTRGKERKSLDLYRGDRHDQGSVLPHDKAKLSRYRPEQAHGDPVH